MSPKDALGAAWARLALALARMGRPDPGGGEKALLAGQDGDRPVVLVWAIRATSGDDALTRVLDRLLPLARVVVVTDTLDFGHLTERGALVEALPDAATRGHLPERDWSSYVERRVARIRASWSPELEFVAAMAPEQYVGALGPATATAPEPSLDPTDPDP